MNTQVKEKWLNALRSGEYSQETGRLRTNGGFCCLGVLCDLYAQETNQEWILNPGDCDEGIWSPDYWSFVGGAQELLPLSVRQWAGLKCDSPTVELEDEYGSYNISLAELNDNGSTFKQIADLIEAQL